MTREKVMTGLKCLTHDDFAVYATECWEHDCPYKNTDCEIAVMVDAYNLLKAQEPRVMTLEEIRMHEVYWAERANVSRPWPIAMHHIRNAGLLDGPVYQDYMGDNFNTKEYGKTWRIWTAYPTIDQREAAKWK